MVKSSSSRVRNPASAGRSLSVSAASSEALNWPWVPARKVIEERPGRLAMAAGVCAWVPVQQSQEFRLRSVGSSGLVVGFISGLLSW